jgi:hypothetical protein
LRSTTKRPTPQREIEELTLQPAACVQNAQQTAARAEQETGQQNIPAPDPAISKLMIRRIMAALMVEE